MCVCVWLNDIESKQYEFTLENYWIQMTTNRKIWSSISQHHTTKYNEYSNNNIH